MPNRLGNPDSGCQAFPRGLARPGSLIELALGLEIILGFATASDLVGVEKSENSDDPEKFFREVVLPAPEQPAIR